MTEATTSLTQRGLALFVSCIDDTSALKPRVEMKSLESVLSSIFCEYDTIRIGFSRTFWDCYSVAKSHAEKFSSPRSQIALEDKALNNLQTAMTTYSEKIGDWINFVQMLRDDVRDFHTLPQFTLRRIVQYDLSDENNLSGFIAEIKCIERNLGRDYLDKIAERCSDIKTDVIVAIENIR